MTRHLLVTNDFPPKTGGIQVYLYELWRRLEPNRAVVVTAASAPDTQRFDAASGIVVERIRAKTLFFPTWRALRTIESAIKRHRPDLVLLDPAWPLGLLGPRLSLPFGVVVHGSELTVPGRIPVVASTLRYVLKRAAVVICAGSYPESEVRRITAEFAPPIVQVPPGVDTSRFTPLTVSQRATVRESLGLGDEEFLVTSYSRLVPRKGMDTLIRASARLKPQFPNLRVAIGGSGRDEKRLRALAKRLSAPVMFFGRIPDDVLPNWLGASDLMVMDCRSRWLGLEQEGFGIVFVEAAASGVAQIAGRSGGSHEAVQNGVTGFVVADSHSDDLLAKAIRTLMVDDERRRAFAQAARSVAVEQFDWDSLAQRLSLDLAPFDHFGPAKRLP